ncbi:MAG: mannosyltransferase family protein, partial [Solirubrobacteraceae bacterium]
WRALWLSRVLVTCIGVGAFLIWGAASRHHALDPPGLLDHIGSVRDALAAPVARWDSAWYLLLARDGYAPGPSPAFFPLYPALVHAAAALGPGLLVGAVLVSCACLLVGLRLLWLLCESEFPNDPEAPRLAVQLLAFSPMAFFLSAAYSESLFLAVSLGAFWSARRERWAVAAALGALAAGTRSAGVLMLVPLALLWWQGPHRSLRDAAWLGLVPLGLLAYCGWLAAIGLDPWAPFHAQQNWFRHFAGPFGGVWDGTRAAWAGAQQIISGQRSHVYFAQSGGDPILAGWHNATLFPFLVAGAVGLVGVLRRLPLAYGAYVFVALALPLSYPVVPQPLMSLPRFLLVLFPLYMWGGLALARHERLRVPALGLSAVLLAVFCAQFATWHWVA